MQAEAAWVRPCARDRNSKEGMVQGENYRKARKDAGVKIEQAAVQLEVSITTLLNWETGKTKPNAKNIRDMAALYGVTSDYLIGLG